MDYDVITLVSQQYTKDKYLVQQTTPNKTNVYAKVESISQSEFFAAGNEGIKPAYKFSEVKADEYHGEKEVEYKGVSYAVYRTYRTREDVLELYVTQKVGV